MAAKETGWFYTNSGMSQAEILGPFDNETILSLADNKTLDADTFVMHARYTKGQWIRFIDSVAYRKFTEFKAAEANRNQEELVRTQQALEAEAERRWAEDEGSKQESERRRFQRRSPAKEFWALFFLAGIFQITGYSVAVLAAFGALVSFLAALNNPSYMVFAIYLIVAGTSQLVFMLAISETIKLMIKVLLTLREIRDRLPQPASRPQG